MEGLLFLAHRIPYPPNKGDKIRSFHLLRCLARHHRVYLGAFIDDVDDVRYKERVRAMCADTCLLRLDPHRARLRSLRGLLKREPLSQPYYESRLMRQWVHETIANAGIKKVVIFSSAMAQYVTGAQYRHLLRVADFVDVDSDKWRQYAMSRRWPLSALYRREGRFLLEFERAAAAELDSIVFVSEAEALLFRSLAPEVSAKVLHVENGVDTDYFSPQRDYRCPYAKDERPVVFTGAMDYWANIDAVRWFAEEVMPGVRRGLPQARFYIVGSRPSEEVRRLGQQEGVVVTGAVADVRPYLAHAAVAVAPLRIARGVQNKVLEAMSMARPVITTSLAIQGFAQSAMFDGWVADKPDDLARRVLNVLEHGDDGLGSKARAWVCERYDWDRNCARFAELIERAGEPTAVVRHPAQDLLSG